MFSQRNPKSNSSFLLKYLKYLKSDLKFEMKLDQLKVDVMQWEDNERGGVGVERRVYWPRRQPGLPVLDPEQQLAVNRAARQVVHTIHIPPPGYFSCSALLDTPVILLTCFLHCRLPPWPPPRTWDPQPPPPALPPSPTPTRTARSISAAAAGAGNTNSSPADQY